MLRLTILSVILILLFACQTKVLKKEVDKTETTSTSVAYVIKETVNLRSNNNTQSQIIKKLNDGQTVNILRNVNGWYEILDDEHIKGWLRSDMVGPRELSRTILASAFVDSILPAFHTEMYFDKNELYKTIYLILPDTYYQSTTNAKNFARKIGKAYQEKVYPGNMEIRIMQPNRQDLFTRVQLEATGEPNIRIPILKWGRLISIHQANWQVEISIAIPAGLSNAQTLKQARSISSKYDLPYSKVEIYQVIEGADGIAYLKNHEVKPRDSNLCKLYYLEDKDGEYYKYNYCE